MNTTKKEQAPKPSEQQVSNVRSYFTKEVNSLMTEMSMVEMESLMREMIDTRQWIALLKYTSLRSSFLDSTLRTTNPIKDAHSISWAQGAMAGISDIETYVIDLNAPKPASAVEEDEPNEIRGEGVL